MNLLPSQLLISTVILSMGTGACGSKTEFEGGSQSGLANKTSSIAYSGPASSADETITSTQPANADISTPSAAAVSRNPEQPRAESVASTPQEIQNVQGPSEPDLEPVAAPPAVVAGAYLTCLRGVDENSIVCLARDADGNPRAYPKDKQNLWTFMPVGTAATEIPLSPLVKETSSSGTIFYLSLAGFKAGTINFAGDASPLAFEISPLFKADAELVRYAAPVATVTSSIVYLDMSAHGSPVFGDANLAGEGDPCLGGSNNGNTVAGGQLIVDSSGGNDFGISSGYLGEVCGLQNSDTFALVEGPGPFKPIKIFLPPESPNVKLFGNVDMPRGKYTVTIRSTRMSTGSLDDFSIGRLTIVPTIRSNLDVDFGFAPL